MDDDEDNDNAISSNKNDIRNESAGHGDSNKQNNLYAYRSINNSTVILPRSRSNRRNRR